MSDADNFNDKVIREFRENDGTTGMFGRALVLVHNTGAKSGTEYINPVAAIRDEDGSWLIAASAAGRDKHPAWYHNLLAHPDVEIETPDDGTVQVRASELPREERDPAWERFKQMSDGFRGYEEKTDRIIPVIRLSPR